MTAYDRRPPRRVPLRWLLLAVLALLAAGCGAAEPAPGPALRPPPDVVIVRGSIETTGNPTFTVTTADGVRTLRVDESTGYGVLVDTGLDAIGSGTSSA